MLSNLVPDKCVTKFITLLVMRTFKLRRWILLILTLAFFPWLFAQLQEQKLKELFEAYSKSYEFNSSVLILRMERFY